LRISRYYAPRTEKRFSFLGYDRGRTLGGSFTARARGLLAAEFTLLNSNEEEFGRLRLRGVSDAEFVSGNSPTRFETSGRRYQMIADGKEVLITVPKGRSIGDLEIFCEGQTYEAKISLFRTLAVAYAPGSERVARLSGGLMGRSYETLFATQDGCAFSVAIFLLWHVAANRRRAYRRGG